MHMAEHSNGLVHYTQTSGSVNEEFTYFYLSKHRDWMVCG